MTKPKFPPSVLVADDDDIVRKLIGYQFEQAGIKCELFESGNELLKVVNEDTLVCLLDLQMPGKNGLECLETIKAEYAQVEVIMLTSVNKAAEAIQAVRSGAYDYLTKPFDPNELIQVIRKAMLLSRNRKENQELRDSLGEPGVQLDILGESQAMLRIKQMIQRIGPTENIVLLTGESGTGKTLIAHSIHAHSQRAKGPFISVSCPSLPSELLESEMFGHEKGSFSGATKRRLGRAELAKGGTLFLDEIGEMPLSLQAKLLTFLQERTFFRVGGESPITSDVRIIAATNQNLEEMVAKGVFREDLFFRLNVLPLEMPPLRIRLDDIPMFVDYFLARSAAIEAKEVPDVDDAVYEKLKQHNWPGNIRELENTVVRAYTLRKNEQKLGQEDLSLNLSLVPQGHMQTDDSSVGMANLAGHSLAEIEKTALEQTLERCNNNRSAAARMLGIAEKSIYNKMKKFGVTT